MLVEIAKSSFLGYLPERDRNAPDSKFIAFGGHLGNFTVVIIRANQSVYAGVSKRNPSDKPSDAGLRIAAARAWRSYRGIETGYSRQRPVTKAEAKRASAEARIDKVLEELGVELV